MEGEERPHERLAGFGWVVRVEEIFFSLVLVLLLVVGLLPIVARTFGLGAFLWATPLAKQSVLWIALFGAGAATRDRKHIRIDAVSQFVPPRVREILSVFANLVAAGVCGWLLPAACLLIDEEKGAFGDQTSQVFGLAERTLAIVIPIGLAILVLRFVIAACVDARSAYRGGPPRGTV